MRVWVDEEACAGTGLCEMTCPEVFEVGMVARVLTEHPSSEVDHEVRQAAEECPTAAIHVEE